MEFLDKIGHGYFFAKKFVINKGFANELDWYENLDYNNLTESQFLSEICWVILASGMSDKIVTKIYPKIKKVLYGFKSSELVIFNEKKCTSNCLLIFNHPGKINAIIFVARYIHENSFSFVKQRIFDGGIPFIKTFPFMGKATSYHLAKNLGLDVVKPDRHLIRIAQAVGFSDPTSFCELLSYKIQEKVSLIDQVLWRYATLEKNYVSQIENLLLPSA